MSYVKKTVQLKKEEFAQLSIYIQQLVETVKIVKKRHKRRLNFDDWVSALSIHSGVLDEYFQNLVSAHNVENLPKIGD